MTEQDQYAFPGDRYTQGGVKSGHGQGMTLRDWFAGRALSNIPGTYSLSSDQVAEVAYMIADAMLEARK